MLIVRELLLGPRRFKHLMTELPGIGSNRLGERLKALEAAGIVRKSLLPAPASVAAYELTSRGERLRDPLIALALWGLELGDDDRIDLQTARAELMALTLTGTQTKPLDVSRSETFEFHVGDEVLHLQLREGRFLARSGPAPGEPNLRVACDLQTFRDLALAELTPAQAVKAGRASILIGTRTAFSEIFRILAYSAPRAVTAGQAPSQENMVRL